MPTSQLRTDYRHRHHVTRTLDCQTEYENEQQYTQQQARRWVEFERLMILTGMLLGAGGVLTGLIYAFKAVTASL